jgi:hypothetical protein
MTYTTETSTRTLSSSLSITRSMLFGELVKLVTPIVKRYHSDLYHDALWIKDNVEGPITFQYGVSKNGTHIGTDQDLHVMLDKANQSPELKVTITIYKSSSYYHADFVTQRKVSVDA